MTTADTVTREQCAALDGELPFAATRTAFVLPEGLVYLDGNSLGPLPLAVPGAVHAMIGAEWGRQLVRGWTEAGWWERPEALGARIAPLVGAGADEVIVCDSISVNLLKMLAAAARLRPERSVLLVEAGAFPTDRYLATSTAELLGIELRLAPSANELEGALDESVGVALLGHVDYRTSYRHDLSALTALVHRCGALVVWDLAHSAGAVPVDLGAAGADFAVGCTYKYLNGGPGAPAFVYAARRHLAEARQPLTGWHGHAAPFSFAQDFEPHPGIRRFLAGSPPMIAYAALGAALSIWADVDLTMLEQARRSMSETLIALVAERCPALELASPLDPDRRGSHVSYRHPRAKELVSAMASAGVIADAREPDLVRLTLTPLYLRHVDVYDGVERIAQVLAELG